MDIKAQINTFPYAWYDFRRIGADSMLVIRDPGETVDEDAFSGISQITYAEDPMGIRESGFETVISLISPERMDDPKGYIRRCYDLLGEHGVLLFPMSNRLGIRYFCGDRDPYTDRVFDGIDNYYRAETELRGRCYSRSEIRSMLDDIGILNHRMFGVFSGLDYPTHLIAENYIPREDLANRILPVYHYPPTVFLEEERLYDSLKKENLIHALANSYLIEVTKEENDLSDALYVTLSLGRTRDNAYATIVRKNDTVVKKAFYDEGNEGLRNIEENHRNLAQRGLDVIAITEGSASDHSISMPYIEAPTAQKYLQDLLISDKEMFFKEMDAFMAEIDRVSTVVSTDPITGAIGDIVYPDMVPVNAFKTEKGYLFFDQEFSVRNYPINVVKARALFSFFAYHDELRFVEKELFQRYDLSEQKTLYMEMEWAFLEKLWSEDVLKPFRDRIRRDTPFTRRNRTYMNYPAGYYETKYVDIIRGAENKECYVFGSGQYAKDFLEKYQHEYSITKIIDNDPEHWGTMIYGIEIVSPDILKEIDGNRTRVFICVKDYSDIVRQLDDMRIPDYSIYSKYKVYPRSFAISPETKKTYHIGYCAGAFDMFHVGHLNLLRRAKEQCDYLIVGVISDQRIFDLKQRYPVIPCDERVKVVEGCRYADRVEILEADRAGIMDAYNRFHFDCMFSGDDHANDESWLSERERLRKSGSDLVFVSYSKETSSSAIRKKIGETL